jgi:hypothetical protein
LTGAVGDGFAAVVRDVVVSHIVVVVVVVLLVSMTAPYVIVEKLPAVAGHSGYVVVYVYGVFVVVQFAVVLLHPPLSWQAM